jgi:Ca-activated chloride channel family protein
MKVGLHSALNDAHVDANQPSSQRQLSIAIGAIASGQVRNVPLNLCLVLDHSGSMNGRPLETVKKAAIQLIERLNPGDRISIVAFDHRAKVLVKNQVIDDIDGVIKQIKRLSADGGTAIDEGLKLGIEEVAKGKLETVSQVFLLTDGENEHGDNKRCLKLAELATSYTITLNTLGFGANWNQDVLENIADAGGGTLSYIERPEQAADEFGRLFERAQSVQLTNAYLLFSLMPKVRLAELKPIAQVAPETIELPVQREGDKFVVRLGDLMTDAGRSTTFGSGIGRGRCSGCLSTRSQSSGAKVYSGFGEVSANSNCGGQIAGGRSLRCRNDATNGGKNSPAIGRSKCRDGTTNQRYSIASWGRTFGSGSQENPHCF